MAMPAIFFWKKAPFTRLLFSLIAGIIVQWYCQPSLLTWLLILPAGVISGFILFFTPLSLRYKLRWLNGLSLLACFVAIGGLLAWQHDIRNDKMWVGHRYQVNDYLVLTLEEGLVEKNKSFKANAAISALIKDEKAIQVKGKLILYFKKDSLLPPLEYGSLIIFKKPLQEIKNSGNPGGFDYKRYCLFQGITHQVYLKPDEFIVLNSTEKKWLPSFLKTTREKVLNILRSNIKGDKELGLAEALLIGYKDDLDKTLVQSYTNTGVVHIIAISGLHLGLIYWLLRKLLYPMQRKKYLQWMRPVIIIAGLWLFSLLAGAQPSILRSALMFTCIILGESLSKKSNIYNTLAFSAIVLLCINPYWLWDVGFQLSYAAVLSIILFMQPVYNWFYTKNKILDFAWKLTAVTIAAQVLTLPVSIYHFHQFPAYFLLTNFLAVPLSSMILFGEIFLIVISPIPSIAILVGWALQWMIWFMNVYIETIESFRFSLLDGLQINIPQTILLYICIAGTGYWLLEKRKTGLMTGLAAMLCFAGLRSYYFFQAEKQQKLIVYNVPQQRAIDFIDGRRFVFNGDSNLLSNDFARNFHLKPSRILNRIEQTEAIQNLVSDGKYTSFENKRILLIDSTTYFSKTDPKTEVDVLVISRNPTLYIPRLTQTFSIKQVVFDGSVASGKLKYWKKDCDSLRIPYHDVSEKGAFVMTLN